jgi:hypothetical protein
MRQGKWGSCLLACWAGTCLAGCQWLLGPQGTPADPLLIARKPIESKAETAAPVAMAFVEPPVPVVRLQAMAAKKRPSANDISPNDASGGVPGILMMRPRDNKDAAAGNK